MSDKRKPLPCGILIVNGGTMMDESVDRLADYFKNPQGGIVVLDVRSIEALRPPDVKIEYHSFITGERVELKRDDFAEAVKRGSIKYTVKGEDDGS